MRIAEPEKAEGAQDFPERPWKRWTALSRILWHSRLRGCRQPFLSPGLRRGSAEPAEAAAADATNTRELPRRSEASQAANSLFCLAPREVFRAPAFARTGGGLLPRLFTLTRSLRAGRSDFL